MACVFLTGLYLDDLENAVPDDLSDVLLWPREPMQIPGLYL